MTKIISNTKALQDFVHQLNLMDSYSNIFFNANIEIATSQNNLSIEDRVQISFAGYNNDGVVTIIGEKNKINSDLFPEIFNAKWGEFEFVNDSYLQITDIHIRNAKIGKYTVIITPLN